MDERHIKWPYCPTIGEIYDQKNCGSCWTFGAVTTAADRTCIHANKVVRLSEEDLEYCRCSDRYGVCHGATLIWHSNSEKRKVLSLRLVNRITYMN